MANLHAGFGQSEQLFLKINYEMNAGYLSRKFVVFTQPAGFLCLSVRSA
jgi:hypothetical protein